MTPDERFALTGPRPDGMIPVRDGVAHPELFTQELLDFFDGAVPPDAVGAAREPFVGITTDGHPLSGLSLLGDDGFDPAPAARAGDAFLSTLSDAERMRAQRPMSSPEWRMWTNAFPMVDQELHGIWLSQASGRQRDAAMAVVEASLSSRGYRLTRSVMRLNAWLGGVHQQNLD